MARPLSRATAVADRPDENAEAPGRDPADSAESTAARHRAAALQALACGHGVQWAADITGLPVRLVARVAAEHRVPAAPPEPDFPGGPSPWDALVLTPGSLYLRRAGRGGVL